MAKNVHTEYSMHTT